VTDGNGATVTPSESDKTEEAQAARAVLVIRHEAAMEAWECAAGLLERAGHSSRDPVASRGLLAGAGLVRELALGVEKSFLPQEKFFIGSMVRHKTAPELGLGIVVKRDPEDRHKCPGMPLVRWPGGGMGFYGTLPDGTHALKLEAP